MAVKFKNSININDQYTLPSTVGLTNQYLKVNDAATGELVFADLSQPTQVSTIAYEVRNETGVSIPKGSVVYISGGSGASGHVTISLSTATSEAGSSKTFGITAETIANNSTGDVVLEGIIEGIDTSAFTAGGTLWLGDTPGSIQAAPPPSTPSHAVFVGYAVRVQQNNGSLFVKIQNGYELEELHDVLVTSATDGQVLTWDAANGYWKNSDLISGDGTFSIDTDIFTANGVQTEFTLSYPIASENNVQVYIDGVYQSKDNYTTSGTTLTFAVAPPNTTSVEAVHIFAVDVSPVATNEFVGNGVQTTFTLSQSLPSQSRTMVFIEGVYQEKSTYTLNGTDVVFTTAPQDGYSIEVMSLGSVIAGANSLESVVAGAGISVSTVGLDSTITNTAPDQTVSLTGLNGTAVTGTYPDFTINTSSLDGRITTAEGNISTLQSTIIDGSGTANYVTKWTDADTITNSVIYDDGTNVGIGTDNPIVPLTLYGTMRIKDGGASTGTKIGYDNSSSANFQIYNYQTGNIEFATAGTERMRITSSGNVGIGTSSPIRDFTIAKSAPGGQVRAEINNTSNTVDSHGVVSIYSGGISSGDAFLHWQIANSTAWSMGIDNSDSDKLKISQGFGHGINDRLTIDTSGNVGIGTSSPSTAKLVIETGAGSGIDLYRSATNASFEAFRFRDSSNANTEASIGWGSDQLRLNSTNNTVFTTAGTERMRIDSSGNVGINTTTGTGTLNVKASTGNGLISITSGTITSDSIRINSGGSTTNWLEYRGYLGHAWFTDAGLGDTERMRIDSIGRVGIGTSSPAALQEIFVTSGSIKALRLNTNFPNGNSVDLNPYVTGLNNGGFEVRLNDATKLAIWTNGDLHVDGDVIAYSTTISDERLKDDVQTIDNALDKVSNLRGVSYTWNNGNRKGQKDLGLIAQEVEQVLPELVREKEMPMIDGGTYKTVDYEKIVGVLIEAVKELTEKVNKLESR